MAKDERDSGILVQVCVECGREYTFEDDPPPEDLKCEKCGGTEIQRYPVSCVHGARIATKCQGCLHIVAIERPSAEDMWPPFRSATYEWDASLSERAARAFDTEKEG